MKICNMKPILWRLENMQHEADPLPKFSPNPMKIFKSFKSNTEELRSILENTDKIDEIIDNFLTQDYLSDSFLTKSFLKSIQMMRLASEERKFTLTPLVGKYNNSSDEVHQIQSILERNSEIDHIFVNPIAGVENFYYHYLLHIPIPKDFSCNGSLISTCWLLI
jgi:hypothetical protein